MVTDQTLLHCPETPETRLSELHRENIAPLEVQRQLHTFKGL